MISFVASNAFINMRLTETKKFLKENPTENKIVIVRIFDVNVKTLILYIRRSSNEKSRGVKIMLNDQQMTIIHQFVRSMLIHEISFTQQIVFDVILNLKRTQNSNVKDFSKR